jgi:hypothetical protein
MTKHYIYEIFGRKIGCTNNIAYRMRCQNVKEGEYRIIEEHTNAKTASFREIELQKQYGYPVDKIPYWKTLKMQKKSSSPQARKKAIANTDYKAIVKKTDYEARSAKVDWKARVAKVDWKAAVAKVDYKARTANTDYEARSIKIKSKPRSYKKPVEQWSLDGVFIKQWDSAVEAGKSLNKLQSAISSCCREKQAYAYGYKWKFAK